METICNIVALTRHLTRKIHETARLLFIALTVASFAGTIHASTLTPLHYFGSSQDGTTPTGVVQASNGYYYAVTSLGGLYGRGAVVVSQDGTNYTTLFNFSGANGAQPQSRLVQASNGYLYGTTEYGGAYGAGTVYGIGVDGSGFAVLHSFGSGSDGVYPVGGLVQASNGYLYGTTQFGGSASSPSGTVFGLPTGGPGYTVIHSFGGTDGATPYCTLALASNGALYGTTANGGGNGYGTVFGLLTSGSGFAILHSFVASDGYYPEAGVVQAPNGSLYGTTYFGGPSGSTGTVYGLTTGGTGFAIVHSFASTSSDGYQPAGSLVVASNSALYGTTQNGGANGLGTVFGVFPSGSGYGVLHSFAGSDGSHPKVGVVQASNGLLYGVGQSGGTSNGGVAFSVTVNGTSYTVGHSFGLASETSASYGVTLSLISKGVLYGTDQYGGSTNNGEVFSINSDGTGYAILHTFTGSDGSTVNPNLVLASFGSIYGTTEYGGANYGTIFGMGMAGNGFVVLHNFSGSSDGGEPQGGMMMASNGNLYGLTQGVNGPGTVYDINVQGTGYTILHQFAYGSGVDGHAPLSVLVQASNGSLYGTTEAGGSSNHGTVFGISIDGSGYGILHNFGGGSDGASPASHLIQAGNGALYGTTAGSSVVGGGNVYNDSTVFGIFPNGSGYGILQTFPSQPFTSANLVQASNGLLYGTATSNSLLDGTATNTGSIYNVTVNGANYSTSYNFTAIGPPNGDLVLGPDGSLYGVTTGNGSYAPTLFHLTGF